MATTIKVRAIPHTGFDALNRGGLRLTPEFREVRLLGPDERSRGSDQVTPQQYLQLLDDPRVVVQGGPAREDVKLPAAAASPDAAMTPGERAAYERGLRARDEAARTAPPAGEVPSSITADRPATGNSKYAVGEERAEAPAPSSDRKPGK